MNLKEAFDTIRYELDKLPCVSDEAYDALDYLEGNMGNIVEVVRCKDCIHWAKISDNGWCEHIVGEQCGYTDKDDYCSWGVRRESDGN